MAITWKNGLEMREPGGYKMIPDPNAGKTTHVGLVLEIKKSYGSTYSSDDTYAVVWNPVTDSTECKVLSSMFGDWGNEHIVRYAESWEIDASAELRAKVDAILSDRKAKAAELRWLERNLKAALEPGKNKMVKVVKGRKVAIGTQGIVKWVGTDNYNTVKVGMKVEGEAKLVYTAASNVVVILPPDWNPCEYASDAVWE